MSVVVKRLGSHRLAIARMSPEFIALSTPSYFACNSSRMAGSSAHAKSGMARQQRRSSFFITNHCCKSRANRLQPEACPSGLPQQPHITEKASFAMGTRLGCGRLGPVESVRADPPTKEQTGQR